MGKHVCKHGQTCWTISLFFSDYMGSAAEAGKRQVKHKTSFYCQMPFLIPTLSLF